jgi:hypothetical protein
LFVHSASGNRMARWRCAPSSVTSSFYKQRLERLVHHVIHGALAGPIHKGRIGSRCKKELDDFPGCLRSPGSSRGAGLRDGTMQRRGTISSAGVVDVGTVFDEGLDGDGAPETDGVMKRRDAVLVSRVNVRAAFDLPHYPAPLVRWLGMTFSANVEKLILHRARAKCRITDHDTEIIACPADRPKAKSRPGSYANSWQTCHLEWFGTSGRARAGAKSWFCFGNSQLATSNAV